jgi:hypothetical protein
MAMASLKEMAADFVKLERFDGGNFIRWQKKMHFLLTTLNVVYVLNTPKPEAKKEETDADVRAKQKWENDDYICRGHILNGMSDSLFDVYQKEPTAKGLWEKLEARYMAEDASSKKFLVSRFNNYKMIDGRPVMEQLYELERILNNFKSHNMNMDDCIAVFSIIDKLPPSWKDFKRSLKHRKDDMSLEDLANALRVEEEYRMQDDQNKDVAASKVHVVEEGQSSGQPPKKKAKPTNNGNNSKNAHNGQKKKKKGACYHCKKPGHYKYECRYLLNKKKTENQNQNLAAVISEINVMEDDGAWWIDSGATRHVCINRSMFKNFQPAEGNVMYKGNASIAAVKGKSTVQLKFTSEKILTLNDIHYVPEVRKNVVSGTSS